MSFLLTADDRKGQWSTQVVHRKLQTAPSVQAQLPIFVSTCLKQWNGTNEEPVIRLVRAPSPLAKIDQMQWQICWTTHNLLPCRSYLMLLVARSYSVGGHRYGSRLEAILVVTRSY